MTTFTASSTIGVFLTSAIDTNPVVIDPGVTISNTGYAVLANSGSWTIQNAGHIAAFGSGSGARGVELKSAGLVTNAASGTITGAYDGISMIGGAGTVINYGSISNTGTTGNGIFLNAGGLVTNASSASITGSYFGVGIKVAAGTVMNAGQIVSTGTSSSAVGVILKAGGTITNQAGGTISGGTGIVLDAAGSIANQAGGTISTTAYSPIYAKGGAVTLTNAGQVLTTGAHTGVLFETGGSVTNQSGGTISDGPSGLSAIYITGGSGAVSNAGEILAAGSHNAVFVHAGGSVTNQSGGTISGGAGAVKFAANYTNLLVVDPAAVFGGSVNGGNPIGATAVSTLELASGSSAGSLESLGTQFVNFGSVVFDAGADWFISGDTAGLAGTISGFALGDTIEVTGVTVSGSAYSDGVLTLDESGGSATLTLPGSFTTGDFVVTNVAAGADVSLAAPCFVAGTRIRAERGEVRVEELSVGDRLPVVIGMGLQPVIWIGRRHIDCRNHPRPELVWPICVRAGTFGVDQPRRDLFLSPDHALFVENTLVPVKHLVNGASIAQVSVDEVTYNHVELPRHDVVFANGLAVETYLDTGDLGNFANGGVPVTLHPDFSSHVREAEGSAPLLVIGPVLDDVRFAMNARATAVRHARRERRHARRVTQLAR